MKAIERVYKYIDFIGIKAIPFEKKIGLSNGYLGKQLVRKADLGEGILMKIIENCPEISPEWLLTGKGSMLKIVEKKHLSQNITGNSNIQSGNDTNTGDCKTQIKRLESELKQCKIDLKDKDLTIKELSISLSQLIQQKK